MAICNFVAHERLWCTIELLKKETQRAMTSLFVFPFSVMEEHQHAVALHTMCGEQQHVGVGVLPSHASSTAEELHATFSRSY